MISQWFNLSGTWIAWPAVALLAGCTTMPPHQPLPAPTSPIGFTEEGIASWYGPGFHGKRTANGERYDMYQLTAAHKTLPFGSIVRVERLDGAQSVIVRINDRGPFIPGRIIDLSYGAARALGIISSGTTGVRLTVEASPAAASDHGKIFWVQVGAFSRVHEARALQRRLATHFPVVRIVSVSHKSTVWHRVQVGQFSSESQAWQAVTQLRHHVSSMPFVVQDQPGPQ